MYYVYLLKSLKNGDLYVGFCHDLKERLKQHNGKKVISTKGYAPWILAYYEAYKDKFDATKREKQLKMHRAKQDLKIQVSRSIS